MKGDVVFTRLSEVLIRFFQCLLDAGVRDHVESGHGLSVVLTRSYNVLMGFLIVDPSVQKGRIKAWLDKSGVQRRNLLYES